VRLPWNRGVKYAQMVGAPPSEAGAEIQAWDGLGPPVLPGRLGRVVGLRREGKHATKRPGHRQPLPAIAAFCTTALT